MCLGCVLCVGGDGDGLFGPHARTCIVRSIWLVTISISDSPAISQATHIDWDRHNCNPPNIMGSQRQQQAVDPEIYIYSAFTMGKMGTLSTMKFIMANGKSGMNSAYFAIAHSANILFGSIFSLCCRSPILPFVAAETTEQGTKLPINKSNVSCPMTAEWKDSVPQPQTRCVKNAGCTTAT